MKEKIEFDYPKIKFRYKGFEATITQDKFPHTDRFGHGKKLFLYTVEIKGSYLLFQNKSRRFFLWPVDTSIKNEFRNKQNSVRISPKMGKYLGIDFVQSQVEYFKEVLDMIRKCVDAHNLWTAQEVNTLHEHLTSSKKAFDDVMESTSLCEIPIIITKYDL